VNVQPAAFPDLQSLIRIFYDDMAELGDFRQVTALDMPLVYRRLLAHEHHMTVRVESHHGCPVDVDVLDFHSLGSAYRRKILLRRQSDHKVVQFGIVQLHTHYLDDRVRDAIESRTIPLGRVLIQHNVLRKVELGQLWRVATGPDLTRLFELPRPTATYGRTAVIHCNGEPAIELLEIVAPEEAFAHVG